MPPYVGGIWKISVDDFSIIDKFPNQICYFRPDKSSSYFLLTSDATCPQPSPPIDYTINKSPFWVQNHEIDSTNTLSISVKSGESISFKEPRIYPSNKITLQGPEGWVPGHFDLDDSLGGIFTIHPATTTTSGNYPLHVISNLKDGTDLNLTINTTVIQ